MLPTVDSLNVSVIVLLMLSYSGWSSKNNFLVV